MKEELEKFTRETGGVHADENSLQLQQRGRSHAAPLAPAQPPMVQAVVPYRHMAVTDVQAVTTAQCASPLITNPRLLGAISWLNVHGPGVVIGAGRVGFVIGILLLAAMPGLAIHGLAELVSLIPRYAVYVVSDLYRAIREEMFRARAWRGTKTRRFNGLVSPASANQPEEGTLEHFDDIDEGWTAMDTIAYTAAAPVGWVAKGQLA